MINSHRNSKVVVLDLGNVVFQIDFLKIFEHSGHELQSAKTQLSKMFHTSFFHDYERGAISTAEFVRHFNELLGWNLSVEEFEVRWNNIFLDAIPETASFIANYASIVPIYAYSNTNIVHQTYFEKRYKDLLSQFKKVFASNMICFRKPDRDGYDFIAATIGCHGSDIIFLDDLTQNIEGARLANWNAYVFDDPSKSLALVANHLGLNA